MRTDCPKASAFNLGATVEHQRLCNPTCNPTSDNRMARDRMKARAMQSNEQVRGTIGNGSIPSGMCGGELITWRS
jgi:hypothetical protein